MAEVNSSRFSAPKQTTVGSVEERGHDSYTVTVGASPSVEQVQSYTTKPLTPTNYVPSSSEFDFMSSSSTLGNSPTGMVFRIVGLQKLSPAQGAQCLRHCCRHFLFALQYLLCYCTLTNVLCLLDTAH